MVFLKRSSNVTIGASTFSIGGGGGRSLSLTGTWFSKTGGFGGGSLDSSLILCCLGYGPGPSEPLVGAELIGAAGVGGFKREFTSSGSTNSATSWRPPFGGYCQL